MESVYIITFLLFSAVLFVLHKANRLSKRMLINAINLMVIFSILEYLMFGNILGEGEIDWRTALDYYHATLTFLFIYMFIAMFYAVRGQLTLRDIVMSIAYGMFVGVAEDFLSAFLIIKDPQKASQYYSSSQWMSEVWNGVHLGWIFGIPTWYIIYLGIFVLIFYYRNKIPNTVIIGG